MFPLQVSVNITHWIIFLNNKHKINQSNKFFLTKSTIFSQIVTHKMQQKLSLNRVIFFLRNFPCMTHRNKMIKSFVSII